MGLRLTAPVGEKKRTTKPDPKKKNEKFKPVKNNPADVELVRLMLKANGYSTEINGKVDAGLIKMIRDFQKKKLGFKKPDGIVDPGMRTWNAGLPKLAAQVSNDQKVEVYEVVEGGKTKIISKAEYEKGMHALRKQVLSKAEMMLGQTESWIDFCNEIEKTRQATDGYLDALVEFTVSVVSSKTDPPWTAITNARGEAALLKRLVNNSAPDWKKVYKQDLAATKSYNKGVIAFKKFIKERVETAGSIVTGLTVVRDTSFSVVEAYITAKLVVTKGMSPSKANAIAAASTEALKSGAGQLGEHLAGEKVTWDGAAKKVFIDSFIAGLAGAAGGKLGPALQKGLGNRIAAAVLPKLKGKISTKATQLFFQRFLSSKAGQTMVTNALKEAIGLFKPVIEKGRPPNMKEIREAVAKVMLGGMMEHMSVKSLKGFTDGYSDAASDFVEETMAPKVMECMHKDLLKRWGDEAVKLTQEHAKEIFSDVAKTMSDKYIEKAMLDAINASDGSLSAKQMQKLANASLSRDVELRKRMQAMIESEITKRAKKMNLKEAA